MSSETSLFRRLLGDRRARIPFALIAVLLLLSAGLFVLHAETASDRAVDNDPDLAMDRTESATETVVRDGTARATERAGAQPLTAVAQTPYGEALDPIRPFRSYLQALIYLEVEQRLAGAGQQVGEVRTEVSMPNVTNAEEFAAALDRVSVTPGRDDPALERGKLRVTVEGVQIEAYRDGEQIASRTTDVEVTVATPLFELHDRVEEYQQRLNAGITDPGFGQRFNARIYALGWARGYAQYGGAPVTEVIANRHVVPAANDAIYRTQQDVFGAADPQLNNAIRRGWFCMAMQDADELYSGYSNGESGSTVPEHLCEGSEWIFGEQATGDPPESPGVTDLLGEAPGMDAEHTITLGETAKIPLGVMVGSDGEHSLWRAVDRIYTIETGLDLSVENVDEPRFEHDPPARYTGSGARVSLRTRDVDVRISEVTAREEAGAFHRIEGTVTVRLLEERRFTDRGVNETHEVVTEDQDSLTADLVLRLDEVRASPNANIDGYERLLGNAVDELEPTHKYERGPSRDDSALSPTVPALSNSEGFVNYARVSDAILDAVVDAADDTAGGGSGSAPVEAPTPGGDSSSGSDSDRESDEDRVAQWLEQEWHNVTSAEGLSLPATVEADVMGQYLFSTDLKATIVADLVRIQNRVSDINVTVERSAAVEAADGDGPFARLYDEVDQQREAFLSREEPFKNVGQKAVYEARHAYFELILRELDRLDAAHGEAMTGLDEELDNLGVGDALSYLQQGLTADPPEPVPMQSSSLTGEITYEVSGSPTYLVAENVTSEDVPAVRNDAGENGQQPFDPLAASNRNYLKLPYEAVVDGILSRVANILGFGDPDAELTFQMAGEALRATDLAIDAANAGDYGDTETLESRRDTLEDATENAIEEFESEVAAQIAFGLYPDEVLYTGVVTESEEAREHFGPYLHCADGVCWLAGAGAQRCTTEYCSLGEDSTGKAALGEIEAAVAEAVGDYGTSTAERAMAIDEGNVTGSVSRAVAAAIPDDRRPTHAATMDDREWRALVDSVTEQAVTSAASGQHVTLDDTDTVEDLDTEIRRTLENVSEDIVEQRVAEHYGDATFNLSNYDNWVGGVDTPVRVPAGMPLLPLPNLWFATVNVWDVDVEGEYARFEVTATQGTPDTATATTYVREDRPVGQEIAGERRQLGRVEPINFDGRSVLVVVVPPGGIGVGDRDDEDPEQSPTWPGAGYEHPIEEVPVG